jgi:hypothetical protein
MQLAKEALVEHLDKKEIEYDAAEIMVEPFVNEDNKVELKIYYEHEEVE